MTKAEFARLLTSYGHAEWKAGETGGDLAVAADLRAQLMRAFSAVAEKAWKYDELAH